MDTIPERRVLLEQPQTVSCSLPSTTAPRARSAAASVSAHAYQGDIGNEQAVDAEVAWQAKLDLINV